MGTADHIGVIFAFIRQVSVDGTKSNNYVFSPQSKSVISAVVDAKGGCFVASGSQQCGNLVIQKNS